MKHLEYNYTLLFHIIIRVYFDYLCEDNALDIVHIPNVR